MSQLLMNSKYAQVYNWVDWLDGKGTRLMSKKYYQRFIELGDFYEYSNKGKSNERR